MEATNGESFGRMERDTRRAAALMLIGGPVVDPSELWIRCPPLNPTRCALVSSVSTDETNARGMATDPDEVVKAKEMLAHELSEEKLAALYEAGILRRGQGPTPHVRQINKALMLMEVEEAPEDWTPYMEALKEQGIKFKAPVAPSKNMKVLKAHVEAASAEHGLPIKLTDTGATSTDSEVVADLAVHDPVMGVYEHRQKLQKLVTTEIPRMQWGGELSPTVHFPFRCLLETGRTSSFSNELYPSGNGQQLHPLIRPCYKARDGMALISVDYSTLELATLRRSANSEVDGACGSRLICCTDKSSARHGHSLFSGCWQLKLALLQ